MTRSPLAADPAARPAPVPAPAAPRWPLVRLLRPRQWIKNGFVLAPTLFAGLFPHGPSVLRALAAAALFCVASSLVYVVNDLVDLESDRLHAAKRHSRPLAAGTVSPAAARLLLVALGAVLAASGVIFPAVGGVLAVYLVLNVAYSLKLKHVPVVDLFCVAAGFVLRVYAGAVAVAVPLSSWMLITTLCLALYLAAVKRRQELAAGGGARAVLGSYSVELLDRYAELASISAIVFYSLYVVAVRPALVVTIPLVLFGVFRYWYMVRTLEVGESPTEALWGDWPLLLTVLAWAGLSAYALWPG
ncbi:MAG TPA: decaprenyl-phosphate phosphoribosyltransferase [Longimicrobiaceae bacterium]|nr:decaprenyl-phosphate phosphoribosyltransferase [Longimicrobiaceae bacterium]